MTPPQQVVVITGASDGIGAELARQMAQKYGAQCGLVLAARSADKLEAVAEVCRSYGAQTLVQALDLRQQAACRQLIQASLAQWGHIDTLVNNAGVSAHAMFDEVSVDKLVWYEELMTINFWTTLWCTHEALPHLLARRGRLVAVSSLAGLVGVPGRTAYSATKFAVGGFMEALRTEVEPRGVSVTVAYPGVVATQIRQRGFNAKGEAAGVSGLREDKAMSVEECAQLILEGMQSRRREVVMTLQGRLGRWLKLIAPSWVDDLARKALAKQTSPTTP
ncbi:MAG: short chain dehydrogenase [Ideonella sp. MAG2]|nr:MAG: short chain dehydrogenase [Ideonella sp. MAG2]